MNANLMPKRNHESILVFGRPGFQKTSTYNPVKTPGGRPFVKRERIQAGGGYLAQEEGHTIISDGWRHPCIRCWRSTTTGAIINKTKTTTRQPNRLTLRATSFIYFQIQAIRCWIVLWAAVRRRQPVRNSVESLLGSIKTRSTSKPLVEGLKQNGRNGGRWVDVPSTIDIFTTGGIA